MISQKKHGFFTFGQYTLFMKRKSLFIYTFSFPAGRNPHPVGSPSVFLRGTFSAEEKPGQAVSWLFYFPYNLVEKPA